jgi:predicted Zn-dependent protease
VSRPASAGAASTTPTSRSSATTLANAPSTATAVPAPSASAEPTPDASASAAASGEPSADVSAGAPSVVDGEGELPDVPDPLKAAMKKLDVGNYAEAIRFAKAAVKKDPENADGYFALFTAYDSIGKAADASKAREACAANAKKGQYKGYCPSPKKPSKKKPKR